MDIHVVSKSDNRQHTAFQIPAPTDPLKPSSIRLKTALLGLTSNNLTYALGGTQLRWWDAYPVPSTCPAPYNDQSKWGIVPAWGLATVLESTIPEITPGTTFFGFWPTSSHSIDLELTPTEPAGHWRETSPHRQNLMSLYNRYMVFDTQGKEITEFAWDVAVRPIWVAGYVFSEYVFTSDPETRPVIHPLGGTDGWTTQDSDLSKAVFVSLAASTKTGRATAYNFFCRPPRKGPVGFLQVTSSPSSIAEAADKFIPSFPVKALGYEDITHSGEWLAGIKAERIVIADFGARDGALDDLIKVIQSNPELDSLKVTIMQVGKQQKVYTPADLQAAQASFVSLKKVQFNTSGVQETALQIGDPKVYFEEVSKRWKQWVGHRECAAPDLRVVWGQGVVGAEGIEGGWEALCQSKVKPEDALVYRL